MGLISPFIGAVLFTAIQFLVLLFVVVATPTGQLTSKHGSLCWTFWGAKTSCSKSKYLATGTNAFGCEHRRNNMNGGAAFAIISIVTTLVALVFGILMLLRVACAVILPLLFTCLSVVTILISWACIVGVYSEKMCKTPGSKGSKASTTMNYGPGFGLMVTAWCLQVVNVVVLVLISFF